MGYESIAILEKIYKDDKMCVSLHHLKSNNLNSTTMKQFILMMLLVLGTSQSVIAQGWLGQSSGLSNSSGYSRTQTAKASITIMNRSDYSLTVKIMKTGGRGLYQTVNISPKSSSMVSFSSTDSYYTKTKATKGGLIPETLYRKTGAFSVQCDANGYTEGTLEFYVSSGTGGSGQGISKSEFDSNK